MSFILETSDLKKHYQMGDTVVRALDGVSLHVRQGEFVALLGTSGSGKSTLLNLVAGLDQPSAGSLRVFDHDLAGMSRDGLSRHRRSARDQHHRGQLAALADARPRLRGHVPDHRGEGHSATAHAGRPGENQAARLLGLLVERCASGGQAGLPHPRHHPWADRLGCTGGGVSRHHEHDGDVDPRAHAGDRHHEGASVIGFCGGLCGVLLGWLVGRVINFGANQYIVSQGGTAGNLFSVPLWLIGAAVAFSIVVSLAAGLYPARRAARLDPIHALRHD